MSSHGAPVAGNRGRYSHWSYDQHLCLKPTLPLVLAIAFLCRGFILPFVVVLTSVKGASSDLGALIMGEANAVPGAIPALPVLYALIRRGPSASRFARWSWRHGGVLLALAALIDAFVASYVLHAGLGHAGSDDSLTLLRLAFDIYIAIYVLASRRIRDGFADFPIALEK